METNRPRSGKLLWTLTVGHGVTHWYEGVFYLLLVYMAEDLQLSMARVGLLIAFKLWAGAVLNMPLGLAVDLIGRRGLIMALSLAWLGIPYGLISFSSAFAVLAACAFLMNVGNQLWHPAAMSIISETYPERRGYGLAIHSLGASAGDAIAPLAVGVLLSLLPWRQVALINFFPGLLAAPLFLLVYRRFKDVPDTPGSPAGAAPGRTPAAQEGMKAYVRRLVRTVTREPRVGRVLVIVGFRSLVQQGLLTFLPFYLVQHAGLSAAVVGMYLSGFQTGGLLISPVSGQLSDRLGRHPVVRAGFLAAALAIAALIRIPPGRVTFLLFIALGACLYGLRPVVQAWPLDVMPEKMGGAAVGLTFGTQSLFSSTAPVIGGLIADHFGLSAAFWYLAAAAVAAAIFTYRVPRDAPRGDLMKAAGTAP